MGYAAAGPVPEGQHGRAEGGAGAAVRGVHEPVPWQWEPAEAEAFIISSPVAVSTVTNYQNTLRLFCGYAADVRYGWADRCLEQFGTVPRQILDE